MGKQLCPRCQGEMVGHGLKTRKGKPIRRWICKSCQYATVFPVDSKERDIVRKIVARTLAKKLIVKTGDKK